MSRRGSLRGVDELAKLVFSYFDKDGDGYWNFAELYAAIQATEQRQLQQEEYLEMCISTGSDPQVGLSLDLVTRQYEEDSPSLVRDAQIVKKLELESRSRRSSLQPQSDQNPEMIEVMRKVQTCPIVNERRFSNESTAVGSLHSSKPVSGADRSVATEVSDGDGDHFYEPTPTPITGLTTPSSDPPKPDPIDSYEDPLVMSASNSMSTVFDDLTQFHSCISAPLTATNQRTSTPIQLPGTIPTLNIKLGDLSTVDSFTGQVVLDIGCVSPLLIQQGDILLEVNGCSLLSPLEYINIVANAAQFDSLSLKVLKKGNVTPATITLPTRPEELALCSAIPFTGVSLSTELHQQCGHVGQVVVGSQVNEIKENDLLTHVNGISIYSLSGFTSTLKNVTPGIELNLTLLRSQTGRLDTVRLVANGQPMGTFEAVSMVLEPKLVYLDQVVGQTIESCPAIGVSHNDEKHLLLTAINRMSVADCFRVSQLCSEIRPGDKVELETFNHKTNIFDTHVVLTGTEAVVPYFTELDRKRQIGAVSNMQFQNAKKGVLAMSLEPAKKLIPEPPAPIQEVEVEAQVVDDGIEKGVDVGGGVGDIQSQHLLTRKEHSTLSNNNMPAENCRYGEPVMAHSYCNSHSYSHSHSRKDLISPVRPFEIEPSYERLPSAATASPVDCITPLVGGGLEEYCSPNPVPLLYHPRNLSNYRDDHNAHIKHSSLLREKRLLSTPISTPDTVRRERVDRCLLSPKAKPKPLSDQQVNVRDNNVGVAVTSSVWDDSVKKVADAAQSWKQVAQNIETVLTHTTTVTQELQKNHLAPAEDVLGPVLTDIIWNKAKSARKVIAANIDGKPPIQYRYRLINYFEHYRPDKLPSVVNTLVSHRGKEELVFSALTAKYGPEPQSDILNIPLALNWSQQESPLGDVFYSNVVTGEKCWQRPTKDRIPSY